MDITNTKAELLVEIARLQQLIPPPIREASSEAYKNGREAQQFIAELTNSKLIVDNRVGYDMISPAGLKFEVKSSKLFNSGLNFTNRWTWQSPFGKSNQIRIYDVLFLLGQPDLRFRKWYLEPDSPYVIFEIPYKQIRSLAGISEKVIRLLSNPHGRYRSHAHSKLYNEFQTTRKAIKQKFSSQNKNKQKQQQLES
jgi:hypothetical protein